MNRRAFLAVTAGSLTALAGCTGEDGTDTRNATPTDTPPADTRTQTDTPSSGTSTETPAGPETTVESTERLIDDMAAGRFDRAYERFESSRRVSPGAIEAVWLAATNVGGAFEGIAKTEEGVQSGFDVVDTTLGFERGNHTVRAVIGDDLAIAGVVVNDEYERPEYVDRDAFRAEQTTVETGDCLMDATVTVPDGGGDRPGVVLVHGSDPVGAADRNLETGGSQVFRDLAEGLSSWGVAVL
ncbi:MAG: hypothetical protein V5A37_06150, partial [Halobacteriales archaeon]